MRARAGMHSSPRSKTRTSALRGPGARFRTCTRCWTARRCARRTTPTCRRFPNTGPSSGRTRCYSRSTGRCANPRNSFSCRKRGEKSSTTRCATSAWAAPSCRRRRRRASPRSRRSWRGWARSSPRTCSMRPTRSRSSPTRRKLQGFPMTCCMRRAKRYAFSDQELKRYFPEDAAIAGLFRVAETLYGITIAPARAAAWHEDVRFFEIRDSAGALLGQFYADLYARDTKRGGAWMDDAITRRRKGEQLQTPVAYLNCNFSRPIGGKPALFTHDEVLTLFHEFGHGLHHLLTRVDDLGVSGLNGVEWDAVELPSQFMENFCWEWEVLRHMTRHVDTGAPLPRELYDKMIAAKNFHSGLAMLRQIEFAVFDMRLHADFDPASGQTPLELLQEVRERVAVLHPPGYDRFPNNFAHIFAGGYAAGYYSYKWAEVLSADAYSFFEENGVLDARSGQKFREEILAVGGSRPAAESFRAFRGREPRVEALLKHNGMISA